MLTSWAKIYEAFDLGWGEFCMEEKEIILYEVVIFL